MHNRRRIYWRAVALRRLELNFAGGAHRGIIESVSKPAEYTVYCQLAVRPKHHFKQNLTLEIKLACLIRVHRSGFVKNLDRGRRRRAVVGDMLARISGNLLRRKPGRLNALSVPSSIALSGLCDAVAEPSACDRPRDSFCSASSVAHSWTGRQIKGAKGVGGQSCPFFPLSWQPERISKSAGLHLLNRCIHRRNS